MWKASREILEKQLKCIFTLPLPVLCQEQSTIRAAEQALEQATFVASPLSLVHLSTLILKTLEVLQHLLRGKLKKPYLTQRNQQIPDISYFKREHWHCDIFRQGGG